ncbi:MAG: glucose/sorbosone dehydrogenase [Acidobacteria bacterium]|nr:glucose/sorbosone dehydrogenase [Acidobacteriota bacterium]
MQLASPRASLFALLFVPIAALAQAQTSHTLNYAPGKQITLKLPESFDIGIAATGIKRVRFFAKSPDGRIFVTSMHDLSDNRLGAVYILEGWDERASRFNKITRYLNHLRNPNNLAFYTDPITKQSWLYIPLTDRLVRYKYNAGDSAPASAPETLIRFPDYGLHYKYGGWHLTRTVAVADIGGNTRIFVAVGSSCNFCKEDEVLRAAVVSMDPDGRNQRLEAQGLRNAVDMQQLAELDHAIFATNMGDDHLGDKLPEDTFFRLFIGQNPAQNYGWPTCYFAGGRAVLDKTPLPSLDDARANGKTAPKPAGSASATRDSVYGDQKDVAAAGTNLTAGGGHHETDPNANLGKASAPLKSCEKVPPAYTTLAAHSSPLGFAYFSKQDPALTDTFLVALHGASHPHIGTGYKVVRLTSADRKPQDFITGFLTTRSGKPVVHGRPCAILRLAPDTFLLSDDYLGLIYYIHPRAE